MFGTQSVSGSALLTPADSQGIVSGSRPLEFLVRRYSRWIPMVEITPRRTPWMPAEGRTYRIFAAASGYVLLESKGEK